MSCEVLGFNIWTKNMPQPYLGLYVDSAQKRQQPLVAIVDDVLPAVLFARTSQQNIEYNEAYSSRMLAMGFSEVSFVSDMLPDRGKDLEYLYSMSSRLSLPAFMELLPENKSSILDDLTLTETIDTCWQILVLEAGIAYHGITRYLTGKRSSALFHRAKKIIDGFEFDIIDG